MKTPAENKAAKSVHPAGFRRRAEAPATYDTSAGTCPFCGRQLSDGLCHPIEGRGWRCWQKGLQRDPYYILTPVIEYPEHVQRARARYDKDIAEAGACMREAQDRYDAADAALRDALLEERRLRQTKKILINNSGELVETGGEHAGELQEARRIVAQREEEREVLGRQLTRARIEWHKLKKMQEHDGAWAAHHGPGVVDKIRAAVKL